MFKKLVVLLLLVSVKSLAQTTPNIGFDDGTFNRWETFTGSIDPLGNVTVTAAPPVAGRQTIIGPESTGVIDMYGLFPIRSPNGSDYSVMLGNATSARKADRVTYTFTAPSSGPFSIIFNYAVVLENPNHADYQQPKFTAQVYDVTDGKYIDCPSFDFVAGSALPGFKLSTVPGARGSSIYYKDWSTATIDLKGFPGKVIRLEFTTNDCTLGGHFGYAYLDVQDGASSTPITGNVYCEGQNTITLYGPNGFYDYYWYKADLVTQVGHGQSITIPSPPNGTTYALKILPYPDLGCVDTLYTTVSKISEGFKLSVQDTVRGCPGSGVDLTAAAVTAGSSTGMTYTYFTDPLGTAYLYNPKKVDSVGTYYIRGVNTEGCMNILPVHVAIGLPPIKVADPNSVQYPKTIDLSTTVTKLDGYTYSYYSDAAGTVSVTDYTAVKYSGTYYVKVTNGEGCTNIAAVHLTIYPPPPYTITSPNTFTPNGDGINDHFELTLTGYAIFQNLKVFNRYGQLVFTAKSASEYWDGNFSGKNLPAGTYYWVFEGFDDYYNTKISKGGSITLLR